MSNSTKLITLRKMIRDLLLDSVNPHFSKKDMKSRLTKTSHRIELMMFEERWKVEGKLAETSYEEDGSESGDHPSHLTVVETRRYGTQIRGGDLTIEVGLQNPDSVFSGMERHKDDWKQFYTADGQPKPYYLRNMP